MSDIYRNSIFWVEVERIKPNPYQPRREFDEEKLNGLAESIRMYGLLQPLTVTRKETDKEDGGILVEYELVAGERRLRASKIAGLKQIPVIIRSGEDTDQMKLELAIIENLQREDLNPVDRAKAFYRLNHDFKFSHQEIGKKVGMSREYVSNTLRLLGLPEEVQGYLAEGKMVEGHTRPLLMLNDKPEEQRVLVKEILLKHLTVRESETLARRAAQDKVSDKHKINPEILSLERKLTEKLGTRVQIEQKENGGKVVISFFSAEDLSSLLDNMKFEEGHTVADVFNGKEKQKSETPEVKNEAVSEMTQPSPVYTEPTSLTTEESTEHEDVPQTVHQEDETQNTNAELFEGASEENVDSSAVGDSVEPLKAESVLENIPEEEVAQEDVPEKEAVQEDIPEKEAVQEHSITDRFKDFLTGHASEKDDEEKVEKVEKVQQPMVEPSDQYPLPESHNTPPQEDVPTQTQAETEETKEDATEQMLPAQQGQDVETKEDEDADMYSIRNFSI